VDVTVSILLLELLVIFVGADFNCLKSHVSPSLDLFVVFQSLKGTHIYSIKYTRMRAVETFVGRNIKNSKVLESLCKPKTHSLALFNPHYSFQRFSPFLSFFIFHDAKNANHQFTHFSSSKISKHEKTKEQKNHVKQQAKPRKISRRTLFFVLTLRVC
jgi:hypothetical protein